MAQVHDIAAAYLARGWQVVPIPPGTKAPTIRDWPSLRLRAADVHSYFTPYDGIGVILGEPSGWLVDVDLDAPEARAAAPLLLPPTCVFGRASSPCSHYLYVSPGAQTHRFPAPGGTVIAEIRSTGCQTVFPGSKHPSGEAVVWHTPAGAGGAGGAAQGAPTALSAEDLLAVVGRVAAAALLARHWPLPGSRQDAALALAGGLLRAGWSEADAARFVEAVTTAAPSEDADGPAGRTELRKRAATVVHTARKQLRGGHTTGWPTLARLVGPEVVDRVREWLRIAGNGAARGTNGAAGANAATANAVVPEVAWVPLAKIQPKRVEFLIDPYLPRGEVTILDGDPGAGKTFCWMALAAELTGSTICRLPYPHPPFRGNARVAVITAEDDPERTIRPRLEALGADLSLVYILCIGDEHACATIADFADLVAPQLRELRPDLVVIDPLTAFFSGNSKLDLAAANEVRAVLRPLQALARELNCAVLIMRHFRKASGKAIYRGIGSIDFSALARSILSVGERDGMRYMAHSKSNLAEKGFTLSFEISGRAVPPFRWTGVVEGITGDDLTDADRQPRDTSALDEAVEFLQSIGEPLPVEEVMKQARAFGISKMTLRRAKEKLGWKAVHVGTPGVKGGGTWWWCPPGASPPNG